MSTTPEINERPEQPYVAVRADVTMAELPEFAHRFGEVFGWLAEHGAAPAGAPFFRYNVIDMERKLNVEAGVPVAAAVAGDDGVIAATLPAGRYVTYLHVGPYDGLIGAVETLRHWGDTQGVEWDSSDAEDGEHWGCRLDIYITDPSEEPDASKWETELAFRLAD
jgi:effector-binding domain-containing protein